MGGAQRYPSSNTVTDMMGIASLHPSYGVSRETPLRRRLRPLPSCFRAQIGRQDTQCGRRQAIEAARLPYRARSGLLQLRARLIGESWYVGVVDIGQDQSFVAAERIDVRGLALQIDVVFGVDLQVDR